MRGEGTFRDGQAKTLSRYGISGLPESPYKFSEILYLLRNMKDSVREVGVDERDKGVLEFVYGLMTALECHLKSSGAKDAGEREQHRDAFLQQLSAEIISFENLAKLHEETEERLSGCRSNSLLLPSPEDIERILRYEAALERQFERKVQQLVSWRRAKGEAAPAGISDN